MSVSTLSTTIVVDCADPAALAAFYGKATGWDVTSSDAEYAALGNGGPVQIAFQRVEGHRAPDWPSAPARTHLDLTVRDVGSTVAELLAAGAGKPAFQPGEDSWVVLTDPEGHPFCLAAGE
ncbi:VOC family protein [Streptomyces sp. NRRL F-5123]|uniref:VOC family protein n=1 Tax=Streptomyces sp. NRRL F-5123 TaxID=1463856 RepID=UPI0004E13539|nr:VOC family protein [Streptomyces sp. NRRL F-5123]